MLANRFSADVIENIYFDEGDEIVINKKLVDISTKELSRRHWATFEDSHKGYASKKEDKKILTTIGKN